MTEETSTASESATETAPVVEQSTGSTMLSPDGGQSDWREVLPEDLRNDALIKGIDSVDNLAKGYIHAQKMVGADKVIVPNQHSSEEDWQQFFNKVGRPETADQYKIDLDNKAVDDDFINAFRGWSHKAGLTPRQAETLAKEYNEFTSGLLENQQKLSSASSEEQIASLKNTWGEHFDQNVNVANIATGEMIKKNEAFKVLADDPKYGNDPVIIQLMSEVGKLFKEDMIRGKADGLSGFSVMTAEQADQEIMKLQQDPNGAYYDNRHANHKATVEKMQQLFKIKASGGQNAV